MPSTENDYMDWNSFLTVIVNREEKTVEYKHTSGAWGLLDFTRRNRGFMRTLKQAAQSCNLESIEYEMWLDQQSKARAHKAQKSYHRFLGKCRMGTLR